MQGEFPIQANFKKFSAPTPPPPPLHLPRYHQNNSFVDTKIFSIKFWNFTKFLHRLDLPQVKRDLTSTKKRFVFEFPHELLNDLRLGTLINCEVLGNPQIWVGKQPSIQSPLHL